MQLEKDIEWLIKHQKLRDKSERKHNKLRINLDRRAYELQAKEYERRLDDLNHENVRILAAQEKSISVDKFEGAISQVYEKIESTNREVRKDITDLKEFKQKQDGKGQGSRDVMDIIKLVIIIAGFFIAYFVIKK